MNPLPLARALRRRLDLTATLLVAATALVASAPAATPNEIHLLIRADDMGSCHAANLATIQCYREGIVRSAEVIVPGPWFPEAVKLLAENPGLDVGVHLTLTSEWDLLKWRPLTPTPSLVDGDGYFHPNVGAPEKPDSGPLGATARPEEIERELRAQIELARKHIKNLSHLSTHMFWHRASPAIQAIVEKLAKEYALPIEIDGVQPLGSLGEWPKTTAAQKEDAMAAHLERIGPGTWFFLEHPGADDPEMRAMGVMPWYPNVAADRDGVTRLFTSPRIREIVARRGIRLVSYGDLLRERTARP